jgi:hypothetical protein
MSDTAATMLSRRRALGLGAGLTVGATLWSPGAPAASAAERIWRRDTSANGWPVIDRVPEHRVEGAANVRVALLDGEVSTVLLYVARRFSYEIDTLRPGDLQGHATDRHTGAAFESNQLSGTAMAIRPLFYPLGAQQGTGLAAHERTVVWDILADCAGVVAWGGDLDPVKESHFQIDVAPGDGRLTQLARRIQGWNETPGQGAGAVDAFAPDRIRRAKAAAVNR